MKNVANKILQAWFQALYNNVSVPVYRLEAPPEEMGDYILLRMESETYSPNNENFVTNPVIITEVVTVFNSRNDDGKAAEIDDEIATLVFETPGRHRLPQQDGIYITDIRRINATYIGEDDGTRRYHTLVTRNLHRVVQQLN